jgi:hypothetical protein
MTLRISLVAACLALGLVVERAAAPQSAGATRVELRQWFEQLRAGGADVASPQRWRYTFSARSTRPLEALSVELVAAGYAIEVLAAGTAGRAQLSVTRTELSTPAELERRNRDLRSLAGKHGARYEGLDIASAAAP